MKKSRLLLFTIPFLHLLAFASEPKNMHSNLLSEMVKKYSEDHKMREANCESCQKFQKKNVQISGCLSKLKINIGELEIELEQRKKENEESQKTIALNAKQFLQQQKDYEKEIAKTGSFSFWITHSYTQNVISLAFFLHLYYYSWRPLLCKSIASLPKMSPKKILMMLLACDARGLWRLAIYKNKGKKINKGG